MKDSSSIISYKDDWYGFSDTEKHALAQAVKLLPEVAGALYLAFPWTSVINHFQANLSKSLRLTALLQQAEPLVKEQNHVITVCQHIDLLNYQSIFAKTGVTHLFWPLATEQLNFLPDFPNIQVFPFPLATAQAPDCNLSEMRNMKYLYSFVETKTKGHDKSKTRDFILNHLVDDPRGIVINDGHLDLISPQDLILAEADVRNKSINVSAPKESWRILKGSVFSLCPTDWSPNSVRLWESIGCGAVPIVFNDICLLPGNEALWREATVSCSKRLEDILSLPDQLEALAQDQALLEQKRAALRQLWLLYGHDCFIYDILKLFLSFSQEKSSRDYMRQSLSYGKLLTMAAKINQRNYGKKVEFDLFILECSSQVLSEPDKFLNCLKENSEFRSAYKLALRSCNSQFSDTMRRNLAFKSIIL